MSMFREYFSSHATAYAAYCPAYPPERGAGRAPFDAVAAKLTRARGDSAATRAIRWPLAILAGRHS